MHSPRLFSLTVYFEIYDKIVGSLENERIKFLVHWENRGYNRLTLNQPQVNGGWSLLTKRGPKLAIKIGKYRNI